MFNPAIEDDLADRGPGSSCSVAAKKFQGRNLETASLRGEGDVRDLYNIVTIYCSPFKQFTQEAKENSLSSRITSTSL